MTLSRRRLAANLSASAMGPMVTMLLQLVNVPLFLSVWGAERYGEWLLLSAVPAYLALTDMGFGSVAATDMTMRVAGGDRKGALQTFQSTWVLICAVSLCVALFASLAIALVPIHRLLHITTLSGNQLKALLGIQTLDALISLQSGFLLSGFRCEGKYARGAFVLNLIRIAGGGAATLALLCGAQPLVLASAVTCTRLLGTLLMSARLNRDVKWLRRGFSHASVASVRVLSGPAFSFMAFPAGNALSMEGFLVVIGSTLGAPSVALFAPTRTLTRSAFQVIDSIKNGVWPEVSAAYGANDWDAARRLHRYACQAAFWLSSAFVAGLLLFGPAVFQAWTRGRLVLDVPVFRLLLVAVVVNSFWNTSSVVLVACNRHRGLAIRYLAGTAGAVVLAYPLLHRFGLPGAPAALVLCDLWMSFYVIRASNALLNESQWRFIRAMFDFSTLRGLLQSRARRERARLTGFIRARKPLAPGCPDNLHSDACD
jgi:O-antigen/teichoic acid export membrane protein